MVSDKVLGSWTSAAYLVMGSSIATLFIDWWARLCKSPRLTWPLIARIGSPSSVAVTSPVARFDTPGPLVVITTPGSPVIRPIPCAIKDAFCSWRATISFGPLSSKVSKTRSIFAPGIPKTYSTLWLMRLSTIKSAPYCFLASVIPYFSLLDKR